MYVHVLPGVGKPQSKRQRCAEKLLNIRSGRFFECCMRLQTHGVDHGTEGSSLRSLSPFIP